MLSAAIHGKARSGKDTFMGMLQKHLKEYEHHYVSWAWELRKAVESLSNGAIKAAETLTGEQKASIINNPALFGSNITDFHAAFERTFPEYKEAYLNKPFSKNIYEVIRALGFSLNDENYIQIPSNYTIGILLQKLGTDVARNLIDDNIWVRRTLAVRELAAKEVKDGNKMMDWYPDTRFVNEFETINRAGGFMIKLTREQQQRSGDDKRDANHESETALDHIADNKWHVVVRNDGSLEDLDREARRVSDMICRHFSQVLSV